MEGLFSDFGRLVKNVDVDLTKWGHNSSVLVLMWARIEKRETVLVNPNNGREI